MEEINLVGFAEDVTVVYGALRAAIFDFRNGAVYSVNSAGAEVLRSIEGATLQKALLESGRDFVSDLVALNLVVSGRAHQHGATGEHSPKQPGLDFLWIELTGKCNLACGHCYAGSQNPVLFPTPPNDAEDRPTLTFEQWDEVLGQAAELGCHAVQFIGGEVLLDRRLFGLLDRADYHGFTYIEVYTNGTLLNGRTTEELARRNVRLAVSLNGATDAVHDKLVGLPGSFERTVHGLRQLADRDIPFRIGGVATIENQDEILDVIDLGEALGAVETKIDIARLVGGAEPATVLPDNHEVLAHRWLLAPDFVANRNQFEHNRHWNACWAGKLSISRDGTVAPCIMGRSDTIGNVTEMPLQAILDSARLRKLWGLTKDRVEICRDCEYRYACGDCRPLAGAGGGSHEKTARCSYDPSRGNWGRPWSDERFPSPASEGFLPLMELAVVRNAASAREDLGVEGRRTLRDNCDPTCSPASSHQLQEPKRLNV